MQKTQYISAVKIRMLTFFQFNGVRKIFNAVNAGAELGLAAQLLLLSLFSFYLDAEHLYNHMKWETFQTCTPLLLSARRESN